MNQLSNVNFSSQQSIGLFRRSRTIFTINMQIMEVTDNIVSGSIDNVDSIITVNPINRDEGRALRGYHGDGPCIIMFNRRGTSIVCAIVGIFLVIVLKRLLWDW